MKRVTLLLALLATTACSGGTDDVVQTRISEYGYRILQYRDPPVEERDGRVELVEDLVVGPRGEDPAYQFYWPQDVAVDDRGRMYVADTRNARVQVFDANGEYVRTLGREGQGPGEFVGPVGLAVAGELLVVNDLGAQRLSVWDLEGSPVRVRRPPGRLRPAIYGTGSGAILVGVSGHDEGRGDVVNVTALLADGSEQFVTGLDTAPDLILGPAGSGQIVMPRFDDATSYAATRSGELYATAGQEYAIVALDAEGMTVRWVLRADRPRPAFGQEYKDRVLESLRGEVPDVAATAANWPDFLPVIGELALDGHGHLYVFSYRFRDMGSATRRVEVYDRDARRLLAGLMSGDVWQAALGDHVYSLRTDEVTGEETLVRYRLVEPF